MSSLKLHGGATNWVELADTEHPRSFLLLLRISANLAGEPFQDLLGEHTGAKPDPFFHQLQQYVFSVLCDDSKTLHIPRQLTTVQVCGRLLPHSRHLTRPWGDELALYHQPAAIWGIDNGDFQHCFCPRSQ